jgi:membrane fusion protein, copper/silver efflux system
MKETTRKKKRWPHLVWIVVVLGAFIAGRMGREDNDDPQPAETTESAGGEQIYYCSMHPQQQSTDPDEPCPICGMDLIPMPTDEDDADDGDVPRLRLTARAMALMNVQTMPAERRAVEVERPVFGRVVVDESRLTDVVLRSAGYIERLHAAVTLQPVQAGETLAEIYSPDVLAAMRELRIADQRGGEMRAAAEARLIRMGVSAEQVAEVLAGGELPRTYRITSPVDGFVTRLDQRAGRHLGEGELLMQLADLSAVWIQFEAFENDLVWVQSGRPVDFTLPAYPGERFTGTIAYVEPAMTAATRTVRFRVETPNPDGRLKPGLFVRGRLRAAARGATADGDEAQDEPLIIPATAPLLTGRRAVVYVRLPDTERPTFEPRDIVLGPRAGAHYVVTEGLAEGELVVVNGQFKIDSELQLRGRPSTMAPGGGPPPGHDHGGPAAQDDPWTAPDTPAVPDELQAPLESLAAAYLKIQDALSRDEAGEAMQTAADTPVPEIDGDFPQWQEVLSSFEAALAAMADTTDIEALRAHFLELSRVAIPLFAALPLAEPLYLMHCPMAFEGDGADWVQTGEEIRNPYFGASMFRCGEIRNVVGGEQHDHH